MRVKTEFDIKPFLHTIVIRHGEHTFLQTYDDAQDHWGEFTADGITYNYNLSYELLKDVQDLIQLYMVVDDQLDFSKSLKNKWVRVIM